MNPSSSSPEVSAVAEGEGECGELVLAQRQHFQLMELAYLLIQ